MELLEFANKYWSIITAFLGAIIGTAIIYTQMKIAVNRLNEKDESQQKHLESLEKSQKEMMENIDTRLATYNENLNRELRVFSLEMKSIELSMKEIQTSLKFISRELSNK